MKKQLLFSASIFVSGLLCAQVSSKVSKVPSHLTNQSLKKSAVIDDKTYAGEPFQTKAQEAINKKNLRVAATTETIIGNTNYDLQSNGSVGDRIVVNADGSIAACWTFSEGDQGTYADRGTGYNYSSNNGTTWGPVPTARVENTKVGWGNIVNTRSGKDVILSHNGDASLLHLATRATKGSGTWNNSTSTITNVSGGNWWPRMVSSSPNGGDTIYAISISYPVANGGTVYNGLDGAILFSRSKDGGATWDIENQIPTGLTSAQYNGFSGDGYAIAAKGSTVAIVAGDSGTDLTLAKSTDGGVTWTSSIVMQFPISKWDQTTVTSDIDNDAIPDTLDTNDGNMAIALDNNGKAFVAYGRMRIFNDIPDANGASYFPYTDGLYIWNESMPAHVAGLTPGNNVAAVIEDLGEQGTIYFPTVATGSFPFGLTRGNSLTSFPSLAFDASNTLYMAYSAIVDSLLSVDLEKVVRHEFIIRSCDGGANWTTPFDVVPQSIGAEFEGIYGSIAKNVDGSVHMIYQRDNYVGNGIPATSGPANPDGDQLDAGNEIVYVKVPTADLPACPTIITGIKNTVAATNLTLYPNPTSGILNINTIEVKSLVEIFNVIGEKVYSNTIVKGNNVIDLSSLSNGAYFVKINSNNQITTKKVILSK